MLLHGLATLGPITDQQQTLMAEHEALIGFTIRTQCAGHFGPGYDVDDAWQDGWFGLAAAAAKYQPELGKFSPLAVREITKAIRRGQGIAHGRNWRRKTTQRRTIDRTTVATLDALDLDRLTATTPDPEAVAVANDLYDRAVAAGRRACTDHIDRAVLAWILDPNDTRPSDELAALYRRSGQAIRNRRHRLTDTMARTLHR
jgi:hypothetical protein